MILLTGATGSVGKLVLDRLATAAVPIRAMSRKPKAIEAASNVTAVAGDFDDRASLERACDGAEIAFLLTNSSEHVERQQRSFVEAARARGVRHIVYLSQLHADPNASHRFLRYHGQIERAIEAAGLRFTHLRPNLYMQGLLMFAETIRRDGTLVAAAGKGRISTIDTRDLADVAVATLLDPPAHADKAYALTGPAAITFDEMAATLSRTIGRPIRYVDMPRDAMRDALIRFHMPSWQAEGLADEFEMYRNDGASRVEAGVQSALGRPPQSFKTFATDYAATFNASAMPHPAT